MDAIAGLEFRDLPWLWIAAAVPVALVFLARRERLRRTLANRFVSERLRGRDRLRAARPAVLAAGLLLAVVALAGPRRGFQTVEMDQRESNRVIALDVSASMNAEDLGISRLSAAKAIAKRLIESESGRVGLVVFEGVPQVVAPLTSDREAVITLLDSIEAGELSEPGSDFGAAIVESMRVAAAAGNQKADVVLISDGEEQNSSPVAPAIDRAKASGIRISTIVAGTEEGARIPLGGSEFLRDDSGNEVTTVARRDAMMKIASATGGRFWFNPFSERALASVVAGLGSLSEGSAKREEVRVPLERYQWPLAAAFLALFLGSVLNRGAE